MSAKVGFMDRVIFSCALPFNVTFLFYSFIFMLDLLLSVYIASGFVVCGCCLASLLALWNGKWVSNIYIMNWYYLTNCLVL